MPWYVIQTYTGKEEKTVEMMRRIIPRALYNDCFVVYREQLMKRQQENRVYIERAFPGYAFITADDPDSLFFYLKKVPAMSKMISDGDFCFLSLDPAEAEFLGNILDENHVVRLSYVSTDGKDHILYTSGPMTAGMSRVVSYQFRKRYAVVRLVLAGAEKDVRLGIVLNDDIRRELAYGKVEAPLQVPERYLLSKEPVKVEKGPADGKTAEEPGCPARSGKAVRRQACLSGEKAAEEPGCLKRNGKTAEELGRPARSGKTAEEPRHPAAAGGAAGIFREEFLPGETVLVVSGVFAGMPAVIYQVRKHVLRIGVHLFGQDMMVEVPAETVRKTAA